MPVRRRTPPACHTYARGSATRGAGSCCTCRRTSRRCRRHHQEPRQGLGVPWSPHHGPHQPCGYSKWRWGLRRGWGGRQRWGRHTQHRVLGRWESSEVKKREDKPNSGDGDAGVRGGAAASKSAARTNSERGRVSARCWGGREQGWGLWRGGGWMSKCCLRWE